MKNSINSILKFLVSLLLIMFSQNSLILGQQIIDANITGSIAANNICIDCLEPTTIDDAGEIFQNEGRLYALDENEEGYALWKLTNFTSYERVNLNLFSIGVNAGIVGYSVSIDNNKIYIERWGTDTVESYDFNTPLDDNEIKIERKDGVINYYIDNDLITTFPNAYQGALYASFTINNSGGGSAVDPNIYFTFPNQVSNTPTNPPTADTRTYTKLKKELDGSYVQLECAEINFQYIEDYAISDENDMIICELYDWERGTPEYTASLVNTYGVNWQSINANGELSANTFYTLEVTGANKGEKYKLRVKTASDFTTCSVPGDPNNGGSGN